MMRSATDPGGRRWARRDATNKHIRRRFCFVSSWLQVRVKSWRERELMRGRTAGNSELRACGEWENSDSKKKSERKSREKIMKETLDGSVLE